ncbi:MAG: hypothetical protein AAFR53_07615 [Pseudomonadota bacterium]
MQIIKAAAASIAFLVLAGCLDTDAERAVAGAAGGAVIDRALGGSGATGAVIGGAAGVFCDDAGVCQ